MLMVDELLMMNDPTEEDDSGIDQVDGRVIDVLLCRNKAQDHPDIEELLKNISTFDVNASCKLFRAAYMVGIDQAFSAYNEECTKSFLESLLGPTGKYTKLVAATVSGTRRLLPGAAGSIAGLITPVIQTVATFKRRYKADNIQKVLPKHKDMHLLALVGALETARIFEQQISILRYDNHVTMLAAYAVKKVMAYAATLDRCLQINDMVNGLFLGTTTDSTKLDTILGLSLTMDKIFTHCGLRKWENNSWRYYYKSPDSKGIERSRPSKYGYRSLIVQWPSDSNHEANKQSMKIDEENSTPSVNTSFAAYQPRFVLVGCYEWQSYIQTKQFEISFNEFVKGEMKLAPDHDIFSVLYQRDVTNLSDRLPLPVDDGTSFPDFSHCHMYFLRKDWFKINGSEENILNLQHLNLKDANLINADLSETKLLNIQGCNLSFCDLTKADMSEFHGPAIFNFARLDGCIITKDTHKDSRSDFSNCKGENSLVIKDHVAEEVHDVRRTQDSVLEMLKNMNGTGHAEEPMVDLSRTRPKASDSGGDHFQKGAEESSCLPQKQESSLVQAVQDTGSGDIDLVLPNSSSDSCQYYHAAFIHSGNPKDVDAALEFFGEILKYVTLPNGEKPRMYLREHEALFGSGKVEEAARAVERSVYKFVIVSQHLTQDLWSNMSKNEAITRALEDPALQWTVVPVFPKKVTFPVPFGLSSLIPIELYNKSRHPHFWEKMNKLFIKVRLGKDKDLNQ